MCVRVCVHNTSIHAFFGNLTGIHTQCVCTCLQQLLWMCLRSISQSYLLLWKTEICEGYFWHKKNVSRLQFVSTPNGVFPFNNRIDSSIYCFLKTSRFSRCYFLAFAKSIPSPSLDKTPKCSEIHAPFLCFSTKDVRWSLGLDVLPRNFLTICFN